MSTLVRNVLVVEDNPADFAILVEAFQDRGLPHRLHTAADGEQALDFLRRVPPFQSAPVPDLVLLDLNLPRVNGLEVLRALAAEPELCRAPIVVLSSTRSPGERAQVLAFGVREILVKSSELDEYDRLAEHLHREYLAG